MLVLPLALLSGYVAYQIHTTLDQNTVQLSTALQLKANVNDLLPLLLVQDDATKAMLIDVNALESYSPKKIEAYDKHKSLLDALYAGTDDALIKAIIEKLRSLDAEKLRPVDTKILELLFENIDQARKSYFETYDPSRAEYEKTLRDLISAVTKQSDDLTQSIRARNTLSRRRS